MSALATFTSPLAVSNVNEEVNTATDSVVFSSGGDFMLQTSSDSQPFSGKGLESEFTDPAEQFYGEVEIGNFQIEATQRSGRGRLFPTFSVTGELTPVVPE